MKTSWYVITGGPCSGKSKLTDALAFAGLSVRPEAARILIDEQMSQGKTLAQIRGTGGSNSDAEFQRRVLQMKVEAESVAKSNELIFWERGIPDSMTYLEKYPAELENAKKLSKTRRYKGIFLLERLPHYEKDYARTEDEKEATRLHESLAQTYKGLGYELVVVPVVPISARVDFILKAVSQKPKTTPLGR